MTVQQVNAALKSDPQFQALLKTYGTAMDANSVIGQVPTDNSGNYQALRSYADNFAKAHGFDPGPGGLVGNGADNLTTLDTKTGQYTTVHDNSGWKTGLEMAALPIAVGTAGAAAPFLFGGGGAAGAAGGGSAAGSGAAVGAGAGGAAGGAGAAGAAGGSGVGGIFGAATGPIFSSGIGATANLFGAKKQADASKEAADAQIAAANHAADLQKQAADATLKFQQDQAAQSRQDYITAQNASYGQYGYHQNVIRPTQQNGLNATNSLAQMLGLPAINAHLPDLPPPPQFGPPQTIGQQIGGPPPNG